MVEFVTKITLYRGSHVDAVDLTRFNFDPYTGKKIDWKEVLKIIEL